MNSVSKYALVLHRLMFNSLRFYAGGNWTSAFRYPILNESQLSSLTDLADSLESITEKEVLDKKLMERQIVLYCEASFKVLCHARNDYPESRNLGRFFSPVICFIVLHSIHETGATMSSSNITNIIAPLMYCIRAAVLHKAVDLGKDPKNSPSPFTNIRKFEKYLRDQQETPMSFAYNAEKLLKTIRASEVNKSDFSFTDTLGREISYKGDLITLSSLKKLVEGQQEIYLATLKELLFFGEEIPLEMFPDIAIEALVEDEKCQNSGYSFLNDSRNNLDQYKFAYPNWLNQNPDLRKEFMSTDGKKIIWKPQACLQFLKNLESCDVQLLAGLIFSAGPSARGTEVCRYILRDMPGVRRNCGLVHHNVSLISTQDKTSHQANRDLYVPHIPTREWQILLVQNLVVLRPLATFFIGVLFGKDSDAAIRYRHSLWPGIRAHLQSETLAEVLGSATSRFLGCSIKIRVWRSLTTVIFSKHSDEEAKRLQKSYDSANMHTTSTSDAKYSGNVGLPMGAIASDVDRLFRVAQEWHRILDIGTSNPIAPIDSVSLPRVTPAMIQTPFDISHFQNFITANEDFKKELRVSVVDAMADASAIWFPEPPVQSTCSTLTPISDIHVHPSRFCDVKRFFNEPKASFSCPQQAILLEHILNGRPNILGVLATGFGKTTLIMMIAKLYAPTKTILIILPLLSLHENIHERARVFGLSAERWKSGSQSHTTSNIVTVCIESLTSDVFLQ